VAPGIAELIHAVPNSVDIREDTEEASDGTAEKIVNFRSPGRHYFEGKVLGSLGSLSGHVEPRNPQEVNLICICAARAGASLLLFFLLRARIVDTAPYRCALVFVSIR
jgi:hypothetical protein